MKIISTWLRLSLPGFHQTTLPGLLCQSNPEEPFGET